MTPGDKQRNAVERQLCDYPESTLRDIYKSFFQDHFGPGHLISDTASARLYLRRELTGMGHTESRYFEEAGTGENFYRVSLSVITDSLVSEDLFFEAFVESAAGFSIPPVDRWAEEWEQLLLYIPEDLPDYQADRELISQTLSEGHYALHHSRRYNDAYNPHYRLIAKSVFIEKLLPLLSHCCQSPSTPTVAGGAE